MAGITLGMGPEQAIELFNNHENDGNIGQPVGTDGIKNGAVTDAKLGDAAVTNRTIQHGAVGKENLDSEVLSMLLSVGSSKIPGVSGCITDGMNIIPNDDLSALLSQGHCIIDEKLYSLSDSVNIELNANKPAIIYAKGSTETDVPTIGKIDGEYPPLDDAHVARYLFNVKFNDISVLDTSPSQNHLAITGAATIVEGWCDKAIKTDGSTGYLKSIAIPAGVGPGLVYEITYAFTYQDTALDTIPISLGTVLFRVTSGRLKLTTNNGGTYLDTGYDLIGGYTYVLTFQYDGTTIFYYINGVPFGSLALATTAITYIYVGAHSTLAYKSKNVHHYLDVRVDDLRTSGQIAEIVNKMGIPVNYTAYKAEYPSIPQADQLHEWRFDDAIGSTTVADTYGTTNMDVIGVSKVVRSPINLKLARRTSAAYGKALNVNFPREYTYMFVGVLADVASQRDLIGFYTTTYWCHSVYTGKLALYDGSAWKTSGISVPAKVPVFLAYTFKDGKITYHLNNTQTESQVTAAYPPVITGTLNLLSSGSNVASRFNGDADYMLLIPRALSKAEINKYYNELMGSEQRTISDDVLPENSISLGMIRTGDTAVIESSELYKYDRIEGIAAGNRVKQLEWKSVATNTQYFWDNPFGTQNIRVNTLFKATLTDPYYSVTSSYEYVYDGSTNASRGCVVNRIYTDKIGIKTGNGFVQNDGITSYTSGYYSLLVEVLN